MKIKTRELSGPALDWAVAKSLGVRTYLNRYEHTMTGVCVLDADLVDMDTDGPQELRYSRDYAQGGPLMDAAGIDTYLYQKDLGHWMAEITGIPCYRAGGPTRLIAAMRCLVTSKLGDEIEIPEVLALAYTT